MQRRVKWYDMTLTCTNNVIVFQYLINSIFKEFENPSVEKKIDYLRYYESCREKPTLRKNIWLNQRKWFVWKTFFDLKKWFIWIK